MTGVHFGLISLSVRLVMPPIRLKKPECVTAVVFKLKTWLIKRLYELYLYHKVASPFFGILKDIFLN